MDQLKELLNKTPTIFDVENIQSLNRSNLRVATAPKTAPTAAPVENDKEVEKKTFKCRQGCGFVGDSPVEIEKKTFKCRHDCGFVGDSPVENDKEVEKKTFKCRQGCGFVGDSPVEVANHATESHKNRFLPTISSLANASEYFCIEDVIAKANRNPKSLYSIVSKTQQEWIRMISQQKNSASNIAEIHQISKISEIAGITGIAEIPEIAGIRETPKLGKRKKSLEDISSFLQKSKQSKIAIPGRNTSRQNSLPGRNSIQGRNSVPDWNFIHPSSIPDWNSIHQNSIPDADTIPDTIPDTIADTIPDTIPDAVPDTILDWNSVRQNSIPVRSSNAVKNNGLIASLLQSKPVFSFPAENLFQNSTKIFPFPFEKEKEKEKKFEATKKNSAQVQKQFLEPKLKASLKEFPNLKQLSQIPPQKLSRHNDLAFYPNIQCMMCKEWVCSRNRFMHIESHLNYRPYRCSICLYDNRKEIFVSLHLKKAHNGQGTVLYEPDPDLERRAWELADQCLQHTRDVLLAESQKNKQQIQNSSTPGPAISGSGSSPDTTVEFEIPPDVQPYMAEFRERIFNAQRKEKHDLIEESRKCGIVPDMTEIKDHEELCFVCEQYIRRAPILLEDHVRSHLSERSYQCSLDGCSMVYEYRHFVTRHMKEVHRGKRAPIDLLCNNRMLLREFLQMTKVCFPNFFYSLNQHRLVMRYSDNPKAAKDMQKAPVRNRDCALMFRNYGEFNEKCVGCICHFQLDPVAAMESKAPCAICAMPNENLDSLRDCSKCHLKIRNDQLLLERHALQHLMNDFKEKPFRCALCPESHWNLHLLESHIVKIHVCSKILPANFNKNFRQKWRQIKQECFPPAPPSALCKLCKMQILVECRQIHAMTQHIGHTVISCRHCNFYAANAAEMMQHSQIQHSGNVSYEMKAISMLSELMLLCY